MAELLYERKLFDVENRKKESYMWTYLYSIYGIVRLHDKWHKKKKTNGIIIINLTQTKN